jgi:hypothetical protein
MVLGFLFIGTSSSALSPDKTITDEFTIGKKESHHRCNAKVKYIINIKLCRIYFYLTQSLATI